MKNQKNHRQKIAMSKKTGYRLIKEASASMIDVCLVLHSICDNQGIVENYSIEYLETILNMPRTTIYHAINCLEQNQFIGIERRYGKYNRIIIYDYPIDPKKGYFYIPVKLVGKCFFEISVSLKRLLLYCLYRQSKIVYTTYRKLKEVCRTDRPYKVRKLLSMVKDFLVHSISNRITLTLKNEYWDNKAIFDEYGNKATKRMAAYFYRNRMKYTHDDVVDFVKLMAETRPAVFREALERFSKQYQKIAINSYGAYLRKIIENVHREIELKERRQFEYYSYLLE